MNSKDNFKPATTIDSEEPQLINAFSLDGIEKPVSFVETIQVAAEICYPPYQDGRFENIG